MLVEPCTMAVAVLRGSLSVQIGSPAVVPAVLHELEVLHPLPPSAALQCSALQNHVQCPLTQPECTTHGLFSCQGGITNLHNCQSL